VTISINQFKQGLTVLIDGQVYSIVDYEHVKPGKGAAFCRTRLKNLATGQLIERTFRDGEKIQEAFVEERRIQFLYRGGEDFYFMDLEDYSQFPLKLEALGEVYKFLKEGMEIVGYFYNQQLLNVRLPQFVELEVVDTQPGVKGDSVKPGTKPATLETGAEVQVPLFIEKGDIIKVDTRTGKYVSRA